MTSLYRIRFEEQSGWESPTPGVRQKRIESGEAGLRLLEMQQSATHPEWCHVGHAGCVIEGTLEIEFDAGIVRFEAGEGIAIPPGKAHRHRPRAVSELVRLALVDHPAD